MNERIQRLAAYERKRDRAKTPEPFGGAAASGPPIFVVQKHAARSLHFDFRLERDGVLASWAVPKGVPLEEGAKALAVHVEDHPLEYASFEGEIPKGSYGGGTVEIWDSGTYELLEEKPDGGLKVRLTGTRLHGVWTLVPAHLDGKEANWLLVHSRAEPAAAKTTYKPMLATVAAELPSAGEWLYEVKFDGYRAIAYLRGGTCTIRSRNDNDLSVRFAEVASALERAAAEDAVLDGEVCALDELGRPSFSAMQQGSRPLVYYAFDCLERAGEALVGLPIEERRASLAAVLVRRGPTVLLSESFADGGALLAAAEAQGLEGVVAKRAGSRYAEGRRTRDWLKIKTHGRQEFVIAGYTRGSGSRAGSFGSLVLAVQERGGLRYVGNVGTGFDEREIERLLGLLRPLERASSPFAETPKLPRGTERGDLGRAAARRRGRVQRVDARRPRPPALLQGAARRQARRGGHARARARRRDRLGQARAAALQPGQALLAGGGDQQG